MNGKVEWSKVLANNACWTITVQPNKVEIQITEGQGPNAGIAKTVFTDDELFSFIRFVKSAFNTAFGGRCL